MTTWSRGDVLWRRIVGGALLMPLDGDAVELNASGTLLWELLETPCDRDSLVTMSAQRCCLGTEDIAGDVDEFLSTMETRRLVRQVVDGTSS